MNCWRPPAPKGPPPTKLEKQPRAQKPRPAGTTTFRILDNRISKKAVCSVGQNSGILPTSENPLSIGTKQKSGHAPQDGDGRHLGNLYRDDASDRAVIIVIVTALNVSRRRLRRLMTPQERTAQDQQIRAELQLD